jgi:16S rRNA (guanine966-N2)-methyltransferase
LKQQVRIIGGLYRGKKIEVANVDGLRPTPDRVRETLFNWLMHFVRDAHCLDAFAGTGALGLEAFSRGAASVVFLEQALPAFKVLKNNVSAFHSTQLECVHTDALSYLKQASSSFDLVFLDPPFALPCLSQCIKDLETNQIINKGGLLYVESFEAVSLCEGQWRVHRMKQTGRVIYSLFEKI